MPAVFRGKAIAQFLLNIFCPQRCGPRMKHRLPAGSGSTTCLSVSCLWSRPEHQSETTFHQNGPLSDVAVVQTAGFSVLHAWTGSFSESLLPALRQSKQLCNAKNVRRGHGFVACGDRRYQTTCWQPFQKPLEAEAQLPVTSYQLPVTSYQLPVTSQTGITAPASMLAASAQQSCNAARAVSLDSGPGDCFP